MEVSKLFTANFVTLIFRYGVGQADNTQHQINE